MAALLSLVVMMRFLKRISNRGNLTLPAEVREALGVEEGDIVEFEVIRVVRRSQDRHAVPTQETENPYGRPSI